MTLLYYFTKAEHARTNIERKRLKISLLDNANDPFEFMFARTDHSQDNQFLALNRQVVSKQLGVRCFGTSTKDMPAWRNILMWAHYGDNHTGMCLAFEYTGDPRNRILVDYVEANERVALPPRVLEVNKGRATTDNDDLARQQSEVLQAERQSYVAAIKALSQKFNAWEYEHEVRLLSNFTGETADRDGMRFHPWGTELRLREVILGCRCNETSDDAVNARCSAKELGADIYKITLHGRDYRLDKSLL